jgi:Periplasmic binding protein
MKNLIRSLIVLACLALHGHAFAQLRVAFIDVISGPFAIPGLTALRHFQLKAEEINAAGGIQGQKVEIVAFDNKGSPQESVALLKAVIDQGIRYVLKVEARESHWLCRMRFQSTTSATLASQFCTWVSPRRTLR